jgi:hypothetical protein
MARREERRARKLDQMLLMLRLLNKKNLLPMPDKVKLLLSLKISTSLSKLAMSDRSNPLLTTWYAFL